MERANHWTEQEFRRKKKRKVAFFTCPFFSEVDLHGFFVKEALQVCRNVISGCGSGETVTFVTGRGAHSEGLKDFFCVCFAISSPRKRRCSQNSQRSCGNAGWNVRFVLFQSKCWRSDREDKMNTFVSSSRVFVRSSDTSQSSDHCTQLQLRVNSVQHSHLSHSNDLEKGN